MLPSRSDHVGSDSNALWVIITPVFLPAPGGGAIYSDIIARALSNTGGDVLIITEQYPGCPLREERSVSGISGRIFIERLLPYRAGRSEQDWRSYLAYAQANLLNFRLPAVVGRYVKCTQKEDVKILLHSAFLYHWNTVAFQVKRLRRVFGPSLDVAVDVRDLQMPDRTLKHLPAFNAVVTSSQKVADTLRWRAADLPPVVTIDMPFEAPQLPGAALQSQWLDKWALTERPYLLNPNGLKTSKHTPAMRDAIPLLRQHCGLEELVLVTIGRERDRTAADTAAETRGEALYLGPVPHEKVLALMKKALFTLILSDQEAISRAALEAMSVGGRVLLPNLAEFNRDCASHVVSSPTKEAIAAKVLELKAHPMPTFEYGRHGKEAFLPKYLSLF